jgi:hypothetical protein
MGPSTRLGGYSHPGGIPLGNGDRIMSSDDIYQKNSTHIAGEVQRFYDRHPYPPPVKSLDQYRRGDP